MQGNLKRLKGTSYNHVTVLTCQQQYQGQSIGLAVRSQLPGAILSYGYRIKPSKATLILRGVIGLKRASLVSLVYNLWVEALRGRGHSSFN